MSKYDLLVLADKIGCTRQVLPWLSNGKAGISPAMVLTLERIGWSSASFWMRIQASYELAQAHLDRAARMIGSRESIPAWAGEPSCSTIPAYRSSILVPDAVFHYFVAHEVAHLAVRPLGEVLADCAEPLSRDGVSETVAQLDYASLTVDLGRER